MNIIATFSRGHGNNGYYHNIKFKATAETHGLHIEKHPKYGWTVTTLAQEAEAWIISAWGDTGINASRLQVTGSSKVGARNPPTAASNTSAPDAAPSYGQPVKSM